jgi:hypothetical protein
MSPYEPPASAIEPRKIDLTFYTVGQITVAAFLGAPVAACGLIAHNYRQVEQASLGRQWLIWGFGGTAAVLVISFPAG